jgi:uncharacterized protein (TIGR03083 family)
MTHTAAASRSDDVFVSSFDPAQYLDVLDSEGLLLLRAAQAGDLGAQIPNCPGWTVRDLVAHVGWVYRWAAIIVGDQRADPPGREERTALQEQHPEDDTGVMQRLNQAHTELTSTLRKASGDLSCWTIWPATPPRDFWIRRMVHETLIHRLDVQNAACPVIAGGADLATSIAADGVDEMICGFASRYTKRLRTGTAATLLLASTDTGHRWWARIGPDAPEFGRGSPWRPDAEVHGRAGELLLLLWNRRTADGLEVRGSTGIIGTWAREAHLN